VAKAVAIGEVDQCLGAGAAAVTRKDRERGERQLRVDERQVALQGEPAAPPRGGARIHGGLAVEQRQADRERELEVRATRQLRDQQANLLRGPAARLQEPLQAGDRVAIRGHRTDVRMSRELWALFHAELSIPGAGSP
jgi:hypothetical protein